MRSPAPPRSTSPRVALALLTLVYAFAFVDRQLVGILGQPIRADLGIDDAAIGWLTGPAFAIFYTLVGLPVARLAERRSRVAIVGGALGLWSIMTALTGAAGSFGELFATRMGVGIGEAGCAAPAQSLISQLHAPERRATALSIFSLGVPAGMMFGAIAGGWLAQTLGWRWAFVGWGVPGLALACVVALVLREPPRTISEIDAPPPLAAVARSLLADPVARHMAAGASLASFAGYGLTGFAVTLAVRRFHLPIGEAASGFGIVAGIAIGLGTGGGGWLSDRLALSATGAAGIVASAGALIAPLLFLLVLRQTDPWWFAITALVPLMGAHLFFGPTYGTIVNAVGPASRATAIALLLLAMNLIGLGLGPLFVGHLSDHFAERLGPADGLAMALRLDILVYFWAGAHFLLAARATRRAQPSSVVR